MGGSWRIYLPVSFEVPSLEISVLLSSVIYYCLLTMETTLHYTSVSHCDSVMNNINKMRLTSDMCDVTIVVGNFRVLAHKLILSATAPFFYQMLKPNHDIEAESEYQLKDLDETSALKIIDFCYTSAISVDEETVWPLLLASSKLGCSEIVELCCEFLTSTLELSTCIQTHLMAYRHNYTTLLSDTSHFIQENYRKLYGHSSIQTLAPTEIIDLMVSWKHSTEKVPAKLAESWLHSNMKDRTEVFLKLVQDFPDFFHDIQHYKCEKQENSHQNDVELNYAGGSVSAPQSHSDQSVPLHVCVSCGDGFPCSLELALHQKVCKESARLSPSSGPKSLGLVDCSETPKSTRNPISATDTLEETEKQLLLISTQTDSNIVDKGSQYMSSSICSKKTKIGCQGLSPLKYFNNVDGDYEKAEITYEKSQKMMTTSLNDTNNNDIHSLPIGADDNDDKKDVANDNYNQDYQHSGVVLKCQICEKTFEDKKYLAKHWKFVHGVKEKLKERKFLADSSIAEGGFQLLDLHSSKKKLRLEEEGALSCKESEEKVQDSMHSEFLKHYLHQYSEFNRWCTEQGATWCPACLIYHARGSICPLTNLEPTCMEGDTDPESGELGNSRIENRKHEGSKSEDVEGPLDMRTNSISCDVKLFDSHTSTSSSCNGKSFNSHTSTSSSYFPPPLDISQYYHLSHIMATAQLNVTDRGLQHSNIESHINFPPSLIPGDVSNYDLHEQDKKLSTNSTLHHKKKMTPRHRFFPCTVCHRVFSYQAALFTHMRTHSPSVQIYQCPQCHQNFAQTQDLKSHVCSKEVEKPYICSSCGQTFAKNIHLKRHLATHSGLKPYPCWVCGKRFSRSDHLKRHTQSIHAGSRPHGCQTCGKEFVRKYELNKHLTSHTIPTPTLEH